MAPDGTRTEWNTRIADRLEERTASEGDQYRAAMEDVAIIERSGIALIQLTGSDGESFLHNMLSADIKNLGPRQGAPATFLTNKGKLVADLVVYRDDERFVLELESTRSEIFQSALSRYIISEDVTLSTLDELAFSVVGAGADQSIPRLLEIDHAGLDELSHLKFRAIGDVRVTALRDEASPRFDLAAAPDRAFELAEKALSEGAALASREVAEMRRIEAGRPRFGVDMDDTHMPLEAGLDDAVHFDKGCYIGQEYVVRLAHRGHLNRKLVGLRIDGHEPVAPGTDVFSNGENAGHVTSAAHPPGAENVLALAYVKRGLFEPETILNVAGRNATVTSLPFHRTSRLSR